MMLAKNIVLKGWNCPHCHVFNGEEREKRYECRSCGYERRVNHAWDKTGTVCVKCGLVRSQTTRNGIKRKRYRYVVRGIEYLDKSPNCPGKGTYSSDQNSEGMA